MADDIRWLTPLEMRAWRGYLATHSRLLGLLDAELQATQEISVPDYGVLVTLSEAPDHRLRMSELADRMLLSPSGLTRRIDSLAREGLVERALCPEDRRGTFAVLTRAGLDRLRRAAPQHVRQVRRHFIDRLTPDQLQVLAQAFEGVLEHLAPDSAAQTGSTGRLPESAGATTLA